LNWGRNLKDGDWQYWGDADPEWPGYTGSSGDWELVDEDCVSSWDDSYSLSPANPSLIPENGIGMPAIDINLPNLIDFNAPYHAHTSLAMSPDALKHVVVGNRVYGNIDITTTTDPRQKDIKVDVVANYYREYVLNKVKVCKLKRKEGGEGVGIYVPSHRGSWHRDDQVSFTVTVTFPHTNAHVISEKNPLLINSFETYFSICSHYLHELRNKVFFRELKIRSSDTSIKAESVDASQLNMRTSNSGISGNFQVNDSLVLDTSNGKIDVNLGIYDTGRRDDGPNIILKTSNGPITAVANLYSTGVDAYGGSPSTTRDGHFSIDAKTSNAHISLTIPTIPADSVLKLVGRTSNSPVDLNLDKKGNFEGTFTAETSSYMGTPTVERSDRGEGGRQGKRRVLETIRAGRGSVEGRVYWGSWGRGRDGSVDLRTSNAKIYASI